jgi:hypothetical protein
MSQLIASSLTGIAALGWAIGVESNSYLYQPGTILQTVYVRTDTQTTYSSAASGNGTTIAALNTAITPKRADSLLLCTWMINGEIGENNVFLVHRDGALITTAGYESYNSQAGNQRWSGMVSAFYDIDVNSTPSNYYFQYAVPAGSTAATVYAPAIRSSNSNAQTFFLNRTTGSAGTDGYEIMVSTGMIQEIAQ